jgi:hypothetical protein
MNQLAPIVAAHVPAVIAASGPVLAIASSNSFAVLEEVS